MVQGPVYTCDFPSLQRLSFDKMGVEADLKICRKTVATVQKKPAQNRKCKRPLTPKGSVKITLKRDVQIH